MWQIINTYICAIIMMTGSILFAKIVMEQSPHINKKRLLFLLQIVCCIHVIAYLTLKGTIKTLTMFVTNIFFFKNVFKITIQRAIFLAFLYMIILIVPDLIELFFATHILNISKEFYYETIAGSILGNFISCLLVIIISYFFRGILRKLIHTKIENNIKIIIYSILVFICTGMFFYNFIKEFRFGDDIFLYLIAILILMVVLFSLIKQTIENNNITKKYDKLLEFMVTYETEIEKQRILRHEVKNEFRTIRAKICDKQKEKEIIEYIDEIVNDKYEINHEQYAKFGYLPANGIKGLCYFKVQEAEEKGIKVSLNISKRVKDSTLFHLDVKQQRDFGKILGVFLDNAIEASLESKEKKLGLETYVDIDNEVKIIISNTYNNEIDKEKIGRESFSTKGQNRGHGLLLVKRITENNEFFETHSSIQKNIYSQTITVKNKITIKK